MKIKYFEIIKVMNIAYYIVPITRRRDIIRAFWIRFLLKNNCANHPQGVLYILR